MNRPPLKMVFVAHPIAGDIHGNMEKVEAICYRIFHEDKVIPVAPYLVGLRCLEDELVEDRELGIAANYEYFHRGCVDELWLYGDRISTGMRGEVTLALELGIPVLPKTPETAAGLEEIITTAHH